LRVTIWVASISLHTGYASFKKAIAAALLVKIPSKVVLRNVPTT
jgi:hypothetical protein